jgi:hypothetical protein
MRRTIRSCTPLTLNDDSEFLDQAREFWQRRTGRPLTREDARQITENITGFFAILGEWSGNDLPDRSKNVSQPAKPPLARRGAP